MIFDGLIMISSFALINHVTDYHSNFVALSVSSWPEFLKGCEFQVRLELASGESLKACGGIFETLRKEKAARKAWHDAMHLALHGLTSN